MVKKIYECKQPRVPTEAIDLFDKVVKKRKEAGYRAYDAYVEGARLLAEKHGVKL